MVPYSSKPSGVFTLNSGVVINSFLQSKDENVDPKTVNSFGEEWGKFDSFSIEEINQIGNDYFDILPNDTKSFICLDVGCGSGRWAAFLSDKVKYIEAIDPSSAVFGAQKLLAPFLNTRVTQASSNTIPFADNTFDLVYSLGVLHHIPDTGKAIKQCFHKTKKGGYFLLYLYYALDNRGWFFLFLFQCINGLRTVISKLPRKFKMVTCDLIAAIVYWPLARLSSLFDILDFTKPIVKYIPLSYYRNLSFYIMRNDALDRFGTPLEKRFTKKEIFLLLNSAGFQNIVFSDKQPYWHVIAQKH